MKLPLIQHVIYLLIPELKLILWVLSGNTNGSQFEVYALLGEVYGSGCPLGYLLIRSLNGEPGGKERYIADLLNHFYKKWTIRPIFTLTDKDLSEINAFLKTFPEAKHQLCFWHCLRAIKTRLAILRRRPKYYDVKEARKEFTWIDQNFVPLAQRSNGRNTEVSIKYYLNSCKIIFKFPSQPEYVATKAIPHVTVRFNGVLKSKAPEQAPPGPRLIIRLNGIVRSVVPIPVRCPTDTSNNILAIPGPDTRPAGDSNEDSDMASEISDLDDSDDEQGELITQVNEYFDKDANERDAEDGPDWMFEDGELPSNDPEYVFCPAPHRKQTLHLFTKHFCQHPLFAEKDGKWTSQEIRDNAVYEMYTFCRTRGL